MLGFLRAPSKASQQFWATSYRFPDPEWMGWDGMGWDGMNTLRMEKRLTSSKQRREDDGTSSISLILAGLFPPKHKDPKLRPILRKRSQRLATPRQVWPSDPSRVCAPTPAHRRHDVARQEALAFIRPEASIHPDSALVHPPHSVQSIRCLLVRLPPIHSSNLYLPPSSNIFITL